MYSKGDISLQYNVYRVQNESRLGGHKPVAVFEERLFDKAYLTSQAHEYASIYFDDSWVFLQTLVYVPEDIDGCFALGNRTSTTKADIDQLATGASKAMLAPLRNARYEDCFWATLQRAHGDWADMVIVYYEDDSDFKGFVAMNRERDIDADLAVVQVSRTTGQVLAQKATKYNQASNPRVVGVDLAYVTRGTVTKNFYGSIAVGVVVALLVVALVASHLAAYLQKRRFEYHVRNGDINLEELGVKRIRVPKHVVDEQLSLETYSARLFELDGTHHHHHHDPLCTKHPQRPSATPWWRLEHMHHHIHKKRPSAAAGDSTHQHAAVSTRYLQNECSICLDQFVDNDTQVRVLPCYHLFHPECIDTHLTRRSSLCPLCKQSCLPQGYLPPGVHITYSTVRRAKRLARHRRQCQRLPPSQASPPQRLRSKLTTRWFRPTHHTTSSPSQLDISAPTQEDEDRHYRSMPWWEKTWHVLFPTT